VINKFSDLVSVVKVWWHAPINIALKRKEPEAMTPEEFKKLPPNILDIFNNKPWSMKVVADKYYDNLRARIRAGEHLDAEEKYRLRMHDHINGINDSLDHPNE
jgi:hypothetical protein